ncbi:MAG: Ig-like domain-containing protein [Saprospiraceae bacterium]
MLLTPLAHAQIYGGQKQLQTSVDVAVQDTVSGIALNLNLASPVAQHGSVSLSLIQSGNWNNPAIYEIDYAPDAGFVGVDTFTIEYQYIGTFPYLVYQSFRVEVRPSLLTAVVDYSTVLNTETDTIDVLANDFGSAPPFSVTLLPLENHGSATISNNQIIFTPASGFEGIAHLNYLVCDSLGTCATGSVHIGVHSSNTVSDSLKIATVKNLPIETPLERPDFSVFQAPSNGLLSLPAPSYFLYEPNQNFTGADSFILVDTTQTPHLYKTVFVRVLTGNIPNKMAMEDLVYTPVDQPITFNVRDNDVGNLTVKSWLAPSNMPGSLSNTNNGGNVTFTPDPGFKGVATFFYRIGNAFVQNIETGTVHVVVNDLAPEEPIYRLTTPISTPLVLDYPVPYTDFDFSIEEDPVFGDVTYYPGTSTFSALGQNVTGYNLVVYTPENGFTGVDSFQLEYCINPTGACITRTIVVTVKDIQSSDPPYCIESCVWPGDLNNDGVINNMDLLPLGYYLGKQGPARPDASLEWYGQYADDWNDPFTSIPFDDKHLDANGDGLVSTEDTTAMGLYYTKRHQLTPKLPAVDKGLPFFLDINPPNPQVGDLVEVEVSLGNDSFQVTDIYGFAFNVTLSPTIVYANLNMEFYENSWINRNAPYLDFWRVPEKGHLESSFTRTGFETAHGGGPIGKFSFIIIDIIDITKPEDLVMLQMLVESPAAMWGNSQMTSSQPMLFEVPISWGDPIIRRSSIDEDQLKVFPNPAQDVLNLHLNGQGKMESIQVFDITGRMLLEQNAFGSQSDQINLGALHDGMYLVRVRSLDGAVYTKKFQLVR